MRKLRLFFSLCLFLCVVAMANAWTKPARATSLTVGKYYVIYNACATSNYGRFYLYDNGTKVTAEFAANPADLTTLRTNLIWKVEKGSVDGTYALFNIGTKSYVTPSGDTGQATAQNLRITSPSESKQIEGFKYGGDVTNEEGTETKDAANYTTDDVFFITSPDDFNHNWTSDWGYTYLNREYGAQVHAFYEIADSEEGVRDVLFSDFESLVTNTKTAIALRNVGCPAVGSQAYTDLAEAISKAEGVTKDSYQDSDRAALETVFDSYLNSTTDIQMPESGKAYKIIAKYTDNTTQPLWWNGSKFMNTGTSAEGYTDLAATFICRHIEGNKFAFVSNSGKYLSWFSDEKGYRSDCGGTDSYVTEGNAYNDLVITRATVDKTGGSVDGSATNESLFGCVHIQGKNTDGDLWYLAARADGDFIAGGAADKWYDLDGWTGKCRSVVYQIEEVDYENTPKLNAAGIEGVEGIATWSAPFPTVLPTDVEAHIVTGEDGTKAKIKTLKGAKAVPANTGVLLTGATGNVTMMPATTEETTDVTGNLLGNSAGAAKQISDVYILGNGASGVAFYPVVANSTLGMNKAYLDLSGSGIREISFNFTTTDIQGVEVEQNASVKTYDLSGRLVKKATKGIFIRNGKKIVVK